MTPTTRRSASRAAQRSTSRPSRRGQPRWVRAAATVTADPFRHVVLLMLENRSFDHMLGALQAVIPALDGIPPGGPARVNVDSAGRAYPQSPSRTRRIGPDPKHETENVLVQLRGGNQGFVLDYSDSYPRTSPQQRAEVMGFYPVAFLPALHELAREFVICDKWFCSVPGPTWTNRLFAMSGTSQGRVKMPQGIFHPNLHRYDQPSVFRRLSEAGRSWRVYHGDFPLALLLEDQRSTITGQNYFGMSWFAEHASGPPEAFPDFAFIEPDYLWPTTNDDHPPHDVRDGQRLIAEVYNAIRANDDLWSSTVLIVTYDEHGGFFDHADPPGAIAPDARVDEYTFDRLGVRVPALVVSPWLPRRLFSDPLDHTSVLKSLTVRHGLRSMGARVAGAPDLLGAFTPLPSIRTDTPRRISGDGAAATARRAPAPVALSDNQQAILAFSQYLETRTPGAAAAASARTTRAMRSPADACQVARQRARAFLRSRGGRL